jgi:salicylate hydroxylase
MVRLRVVIIGGGIGGLSTAVALRSIGAHVAVFEQAHQLGEVGAGVGLQQNSQRVLRRLGLGAQISRIATRIPGFRLHSPDGAVLSSEIYGPDAAQLAVHRADLVGVLAAALPAGVVHTGHRCTQFSQDEGSAAASFDTGEVVEADAVIAADGIHSVLQRYVVEPTEPVYSGTVAYRGLIPATRLPDWPQSLVVWGGNGKHLLAFPVRAGQLINFVGFVPTDEQMHESWSAPGDPAALAAEFAQWSPQARRLVDQVDTTFKWGLYDRNPLIRWTIGRLTLLGDAAHAMLPHMGQGANQAIEDAMALATLLRGASAPDVPEALIHYQALRHERTARIQQLSRSNGLRFDDGLTVRLTRPWVQRYDVEADALAVSRERIGQHNGLTRNRRHSVR